MTLGPSMWKKPNLSLLNFFLGFFFFFKFGFFFWKKKPNFQICFFFISEKKTKFEFGLFLLWIWIFSEENCMAVVAPSDHKSKILVVRKIEILVVYWKIHGRNYGPGSIGTTREPSQPKKREESIVFWWEIADFFPASSPKIHVTAMVGLTRSRSVKVGSCHPNTKTEK